MNNRAVLAIGAALALGFVIAQLADLLTYSPATEANPLVLWLGPWAPAAKAALILGVLALVRAIPSSHARAVLVVGIAAGVIGAVSNVAS